MKKQKFIRRLPAIFQTDTNSKFFSATIDQVLSKKESEYVSGHIGRKLGGSYDPRNDYFVSSPYKDRANYQLEPIAYTLNSDTLANENEVFYTDILNRIRSYGGSVANHDRLFESNFYSWAPPIDIDKFLNYQNYYWLTGTKQQSMTIEGMDDLDIETYILGQTEYSQYYPADDYDQGSIYFRNVSGENRVYRTQGSWIAAGAQVEGFFYASASLRNTGNYSITGVTDDYLVVSQEVENEGPFVVNINRLLTPVGNIVINGISNTVTRTTGSWRNDGVKVFDTITLSGSSIPTNNRTVTIISVSDLTLGFSENEMTTESGAIGVEVNRTVESNTFGWLSTTSANTLFRGLGTWNVEGIKPGDTVSVYEELTPNVAIGSAIVLWLSGDNGNVINFADAPWVSKVVVDLNLGPVKFSSGLIVNFPDSESYAELHRVEAVGRGIILVPFQSTLLPSQEFDYLPWDVVGDVVTGEDAQPWDTLPWDAIPRYLSKDYITIERGSCDENPWSRTNSWYHKDVLNTIASLTGTAFPATAKRANRPIIEFKMNLELYNFGKRSIGEVRLVSDVAAENIVGFSTGTAQVDGAYISAGDLLVFTNLPSVFMVTESAGSYSLTVHKIAVEGDMVQVLDGAEYRGMQIQFVNGMWSQTQQKQSANQPPLFNLYDTNNVALDDTSVYETPSFVGSKIFSYATDADSVQIDNELGVGLVYSSIGQISDIVFENNLKTEVHTYLPDSTTVDINGYYFYKDTTYDAACEVVSTEYKNSWNFGGQSKQRVVDRFELTGPTDTIHLLSILPFENDVLVYLNGTELVKKNFVLKNATIEILSAVKINDVLEVRTYSREDCSETFVATAGQTSVALYHTPTYQDVYVAVNAVQTFDFRLDGVQITFTSPLEAGDVVTVNYVSREHLQSNVPGYYEIPQSLEANPANLEVTTRSYNDFVTHFVSIIENQTGIELAGLGSSNLYRDSAKDLGRGQYVIQNESSLLKSMFITSSDVIDVIKSMRFAGQEYIRFKNTFAKIVKEMIDSGELTSLVDMNNSLSMDAAFNEVLARVQRISPVNNTFKNTHMIASGTAYVEEEADAYLDPASSNYISENVFKLNSSLDLNNLKNVMYLYKQDTVVQGLTGEQILIVDQDYSYEVVDSEIQITLTENVVGPSDRLYVRLYNDSSIVSIPSTPSKLGLYTVAKPSYEIDPTIPTPKSPIGYSYITGHDGSRTPAFGDLRDRFILELECRIYNGLHPTFRNEYTPVISINEVKPGKFRHTNFTREEYNEITQSSFFKWANLNRANPRENAYFELTDEWTYNHRGAGLNEENTPGYWRGIYRFYYDTDKPHLTPWQMLGFADKPTWWDTTYGFNYSSTNTTMWTDLEAGRIAAGPQAGINAMYSRPGLVANFMPVDSSGNIKLPATIGLVATSALDSDLNRDWQFGDGAPVEDSWVNTSIYPFAVIETLYLTKPARFGELFWDMLDSREVFGQIVSADTLKRRINADAVVHGETVLDEVVIKLGYQQWISDRLTFLNRDIKDEFGDKIRSLNVKLGHKFSGYTNADTLKVFAESVSPDSTSLSDLLPNENVNVKILTSPSIAEYVYSGVIIKALESGKYQVYGYDLLDSVFATNPAKDTSRAYSVNVEGTAPAVRMFQFGADYVKNDLVKYNTHFYRCLSDHTASKFDATAWKKLPKLPTVGGVNAVHYPDRDLSLVEVVPYGTTLETVQDVYDFLIGYGSYLTSEGWKFEEFDNESNSLNDFAEAAKQYLYWVAKSWAPGILLALSPASKRPTLEVKFGYPSNVELTTNGVYSILDDRGVSIDPTLTTIAREDRLIAVVPKNDDIEVSYFRVSSNETEHVITFDNTTVFGDVVYDPLTRSRQNRLRINASRTIGWFGKYEAPGYLITQDQKLIANIENTTNSIRDYHNVEVSLDEGLAEDVARHLIGFEEKTFLTDLRISEDVQYQFYQGAIREKGTPSSIKKLLRSVYVTNEQDINMYEEWALKVASFGATSETQKLDLVIRANDVKSDPQLVILDSSMSRTGFVSSVVISNASTNHVTLPLITISKDPADPNFANIVDAKVRSVLDKNGKLVRIDIVQPGSGYTLAPLVTIEGSADAALAYLSKDVSFDKTTDNIVTVDIDDRTRWVTTPKESIESLWPTTEIIDYGIPNSGYANLNDVDYTAFDLTRFEQLWANNVGPGVETFGSYDVTNDITSWSYGHRDTIWVAKGQLEDWAMYRVCEFTDSAYSVINPAGHLVIETALPLNVNPNDRTSLSGYVLLNDRIVVSDVPFTQQIDRKLVKYTLDTDAPEMLTYRYVVTEVNGDAIDVDADYIVDQIYYFANVRFANTAKRDASTSVATGELAWIDSDDSGKWAVHLKTDSSWTVYSVPYIYNDVTYYAERKQGTLVDTKKFKNSFVYDADTEATIAMLSVYDPFKGILPGPAERNIDYKTHTDPARYTSASDNTLINPSQTFGMKEVGLTWLDMSELRYLYYEQGTNSERRNQWGRLFPGSTAVVYEWTRSLSSPAGYSDEGTVRNTTDFVEQVEFDSTLQQDVTAYYFWVRSKSSVPAHRANRSISTQSIELLLTNPRKQDYRWFSPINFHHADLDNGEVRNALVFNNVNRLIANRRSVLQINYKFTDKDTQVHSEWKLIREDDNKSLVLDQHWDKMVDSLIGLSTEMLIDSTVKGVVRTSPTTGHLIVPDPSLPEEEKYGISYRPRQSMFVNNAAARRVFVNKVNNLVANIDIRSEILQWNAILESNNLWVWTDWYASGFTKDSVKVTRQVKTVNEMVLLDGVMDGEFIKVIDKTDPTQLFTIYQYNVSTDTYVIAAKEKSTISLLDKVYSDTTINLATQNALRDLIVVLVDYVMVLDKTILKNRLFFAMLNYAVSEKENLDWAFKTTYIVIDQAGQVVTKSKVVERNPLTNTLAYINSVKPYHTKIRDYSTTIDIGVDLAFGAASELRAMTVKMQYARVACGGETTEILRDASSFEEIPGQNWDMALWDSTLWDPTDDLRIVYYDAASDELNTFTEIEPDQLIIPTASVGSVYALDFTPTPEEHGPYIFVGNKQFYNFTFSVADNSITLYEQPVAGTVLEVYDVLPFDADSFVQTDDLCQELAPYVAHDLLNIIVNNTEDYFCIFEEHKFEYFMTLPYAIDPTTLQVFVNNVAAPVGSFVVNNADDLHEWDTTLWDGGACSAPWDPNVSVTFDPELVTLTVGDPLRFAYDVLGDACLKPIPYMYRLFKDQFGRQRIYRMCDGYETENVLSTDTRIKVLSGYVLPLSYNEPGYMWVGNELVQYRSIKYDAGIQYLTGLTRGYNGTVRRDHFGITKMYDASSINIMPITSHNNWTPPCYVPPTIAGDISDGTVGDVVTFNYTVSDGQGPYTFTIIDGELPPGLSMDSDGNVTGTLE